MIASILGALILDAGSDRDALVAKATAEVLAGTRPEDAVRLIEDGRRFDLLVTDHLMSGMTGADLARLARAKVPDMPVLLISGYAEGAGIDSGLPRLTKPFRADELATALAQL